jgi:hypothetical protein
MVKDPGKCGAIGSIQLFFRMRHCFDVDACTAKG